MSTNNHTPTKITFKKGNRSTSFTLMSSPYFSPCGRTPSTARALSFSKELSDDIMLSPVNNSALSQLPTDLSLISSSVFQSKNNSHTTDSSFILFSPKSPKLVLEKNTPDKNGEKEKIIIEPIKDTTDHNFSKNSTVYKHKTPKKNEIENIRNNNKEIQKSPFKCDSPPFNKKQLTLKSPSSFPLYNIILKTLPNRGNLPYINGFELAKLFDGHYNNVIDEYIIIDCRYEYEYQGGHIVNSLNIRDRKGLLDIWKRYQHVGEKIIIVFHCEYSSNRGPRGGCYFRQLDRSFNTYPILTFPQIYILEGGYREFQKSFQKYCNPQGYIEMWDDNYKMELKKENVRDKIEWNLKKTKTRAFQIVNQ